MRKKSIICIAVIFICTSIFGTAKSQDSFTNNLLIIKAYNTNNQAKKAIEHYKTISNPDINLKTEIGKSYLLLADYKTAANCFLEVNKEYPKIGNYEIAQCYSQLNKPSFAVKYLELYLKQKNKQTISKIKSNKNFVNISTSKEWIQLWKQNWYSTSELEYNDADYEYRIKNFSESIERLETILKKRPSFHQAHALVAHNYLALGKNSHAIYAISEAIKINPNNAEYLYLRSYLLKQTNKAKKALKEISNALKLDSSNIDYFILRAEIYMDLKENEIAEKEIEIILKYIKNAKTNLIAGNIYKSSGNYLLALKNYNLSLQKNPNNVEIFILRGDVYMYTKTYEFAERDYSMALDFFPTRGEIYYKRGQVRVMQKKYNDACSDFNKARGYKFMKAEDALKTYCQ